MVGSIIYVSLVIRTMPEIIKMSPVIRELEQRRIEYFIIHTDQHYSYTMDKIFFEYLELPEPDYKFDVGERYHTHGSQTGGDDQRSREDTHKGEAGCGAC